MACTHQVSTRVQSFFHILTPNRRIYSSGHQVASHTWSHPDLCNITSAQRKNEMYKNEMALRNILGVIPTYMRPPYSSCTAGKSSHIQQLTSSISDHRLECGCEADLLELGYHITYFVCLPYSPPSSLSILTIPHRISTPKTT